MLLKKGGRYGKVFLIIGGEVVVGVDGMATSWTHCVSSRSSSFFVETSQDGKSNERSINCQQVRKTSTLAVVMGI